MWRTSREGGGEETGRLWRQMGGGFTGPSSVSPLKLFDTDFCCLCLWTQPLTELCRQETAADHRFVLRLAAAAAAMLGAFKAKHA